MKIVVPNYHERAHKVDIIDDKVKDIAKELHSLVREFGVNSLSAPQLGHNIQLFVLNSLDKEITIINPTIDDISDETFLSEENSLSFPGLILKIHRPISITVSWIDLDNTAKTEVLAFETAASFMHEYENLQGISFVDKVSKLKLDMAMRKLEKTLKRAKNAYK